MKTTTTPTQTASLWAGVERARRRYRSSPREHYGAYKEAWARLKEHGEALRAQLHEAGIATRVDHAYTPNERGHYGGSDHIVVLSGFASGRLRRAAYDALCKPASKFWGLEHTHGGPATCKTCIERAEQLAAEARRQAAETVGAV